MKSLSLCNFVLGFLFFAIQLLIWRYLTFYHRKKYHIFLNPILLFANKSCQELQFLNFPNFQFGDPCSRPGIKKCIRSIKNLGELTSIYSPNIVIKSY